MYDSRTYAVGRERLRVSWPPQDDPCRPRVLPKTRGFSSSADRSDTAQAYSGLSLLAASGMVTTPRSRDECNHKVWIRVMHGRPTRDKGQCAPPKQIMSAPRRCSACALSSGSRLYSYENRFKHTVSTSLLNVGHVNSHMLRYDTSVSSTSSQQLMMYDRPGAPQLAYLV